MPSIKVGAWRLVVIPGDHEPRHVHARYGAQNALEVVIKLEDGGSVTLWRADRGLSRAKIRMALATVFEHYEVLVRLWEDYR